MVENGRFVLRHGGWIPRDPRCPACGHADGLRCNPGDYPRCYVCGVRVIRAGRAPSADCVSPNGRVDGHMSYVRIRASDGALVCAFCGSDSGVLPKGCVETAHG